MPDATSPQLKEPVRVFIDEMANIGTIPQMSEKMATARKYGISIACIFQNKAQIEKVYQKDAESIIGNCDSLLYLGGMETATVKMLSEKLGKATIKTHNRSLSRGKQNSGSESYQNAERELLTPDEIEQIRNDKCLIFIRGCKPFLVNKYPYEKHHNYKYTAESNPEMDLSDRFLLTYDIDRMEEVRILSPMDERYQVPDVQALYAVEVSRIWEEKRHLKMCDAKTAVKSISGLKDTCAGLESHMQELYEKFVLGELDKAGYLAAKAAAVKKRDAAAAKIGEMEAKLKNTGVDGGLKNQFADRFSQYVETGELTAGIVSDVLEEVIVYPDNRLHVVWNYQEDLKRMLLDIGAEEDADGSL